MPVVAERTLYQDQAAPPMGFRWLDGAGEPFNTTGWSGWRLEFVDSHNVARFTKTDGIVGGDGLSPANVMVTWEDGELVNVPADRYHLRLSAIRDGRRAVFPMEPVVRLRATPSAPTP